MPQVSVIIAFYKNLPYLGMILNAFNLQSTFDFEIIVAEDDNSADTVLFLGQFQSEFKVKHVSQPDLGFRKCRILNEAVKVSTADYLVFIDGDCIPHKHFIKSYIVLKHLSCVFARRVMLSDIHTALLLNHKAKLSFFNLLKYRSTQLKHAIYISFYPVLESHNKGIWGCNWGIKKAIFQNINGFDEDYELAGIGEDVDIQWRLALAEVVIKYAKHRPIVYHLNHAVHYTADVVHKNKLLMNHKIVQGKSFCLNGLFKG